MVVRIKILAVMACALIFIACSTAKAGILANNPLAYNNGSGPFGGAWTGTSPFANQNLIGTVDWAVFTAATFNANFGGGGYVAPAGQLVYAHQIFTTGVGIGVAGMTIPLAGFPAGNGGSFQSGGVAGLGTLLANANPGQANYVLTTETDPLNPSRGLVYSSPNVPQLTGIPNLADGGLSAVGQLAIGIPGSVVGIPEPATLAIGGMASVFVFLATGRRRRM